MPSKAKDDDEKEDPTESPDLAEVAPDPTLASSPTPSPASAPVSATLDEAPDVGPEHVLPKDAPSDTREVQAMKAAGALPGLTDFELSAMDEVDKAHDAIIGWLDYAKAQIGKVRRL